MLELYIYVGNIPSHFNALRFFLELFLHTHAGTIGASVSAFSLKPVVLCSECSTADMNFIFDCFCPHFFPKSSPRIKVTILKVRKLMDAPINAEIGSSTLTLWLLVVMKSPCIESRKREKMTKLSLDYNSMLVTCSLATLQFMLTKGLCGVLLGFNRGTNWGANVVFWKWFPIPIDTESSHPDERRKIPHRTGRSHWPPRLYWSSFPANHAREVLDDHILEGENKLCIIFLNLAT